MAVFTSEISVFASVHRQPRTASDYIIAVFVFTLMIYLFPSAVMYVYIPLEGVSAPVWCGLLSVQSIKERVKPSRLSYSIRRRRRRACMHALTHTKHPNAG